MSKPPLLFEDRPGPAAPGAVGRTWRGVALVILIFLGTRLVAWVGTYYGAILLLAVKQQWDAPVSTFDLKAREEGFASAEQYWADELLADLNPLCRFDGVHYRSIIEEGYHYAPPPPPDRITSRRQVEQNIAFFPLYPLLCRPLTAWLSTQAAMILVAHAAGLAAALVLYFWVRWRIDEPAALFAVAAVFCLPPACYYSFAYAESVTLLALTVTLWLVDRRSFVPAALVSGLATAARPTALPIVAVVLLAYWLSRSGSRSERLWRMVPLGIVAASGILLYAAYLTARFGSPLVYFDNFRAGWVTDEDRASWFEYLTMARVWDQFKYFGRLWRALPVGLYQATNPFMWNMPLNFFILFLSLAGLGRVPRSFRPLLAFGPLVFVQGYLASGGATFGVQPMARYMALSVPALVVLAAWCTREWKPGFRTALLSFMLLVQAAWALRFGLREWSG